MKHPLPFSLFGGYVRFSGYWWRELLWYITGIRIVPRYDSYEAFPPIFRWEVQFGYPVWGYDLYTFWHRGRYGWAPRDVWNVDVHLDRVLSQMLSHLADTTHSYPGEGYDSIESWQTQLREWSADLIAPTEFSASEESTCMIMEARSAEHFAAYRVIEDRLRGRHDAALQGVIEHWHALWD